MPDIKMIKPMDIENESMRIIETHLEQMGVHLEPEILPVLKRVIHTSADFDYVKNLKFVNEPVKKAAEVFKENVTIITDTQMALSGINKTGLLNLSGQAMCFMSDEDVANKAKMRGETRAVMCVEKAFELYDTPVLVVGNAPTALIRICDYIKEGKRPALVVGVPVGFVNVVESKEYAYETAMEYGIPMIIAMGNKGGSNVAASICNALIYTLSGR